MKNITKILLIINLSLVLFGNTFDSDGLNSKSDVTVSGYIREKDMAESINGLLRHDIADAIDDLASNLKHKQSTIDTFTTIKELPNTLPDSNEVEGNLTKEISYKSGNLKISIQQSTKIDAKIYLDKAYNELIIKANDGVYSGFGSVYLVYNPQNDSTTASSQSDYESKSFIYAMLEGKDYLDTLGINLIEVPVEYTFRYSKVAFTTITSYMNGTTFSKNLNFIDIANAFGDSKGGITSLISDAKKSQNKASVGFRLKYNPTDNLSLKIVGKNINSPSFDTVISGEKITFYPIYTISSSYLISNNILASISYDLVSTPTLITDYDTQYVATQLLYRPFEWIQSGINLKENTANSNEGTIVGTSLHAMYEGFKMVLNIEFSLGGTQVTTTDSKTQESSTYTIPKYASTNISLNYNF